MFAQIIARVPHFLAPIGAITQMEGPDGSVSVHGFVGVDLGDLDGGKNPGPRLSGVERLV